DGPRFSADVALVSAGRTVSAKYSFAAGGTASGGGFAISDGEASLTSGSIQLAGVTLTAIGYTRAECYPRTGRVAFRYGPVSYEMTFQDQTPSTASIGMTKSPVAG